MPSRLIRASSNTTFQHFALSSSLTLCRQSCAPTRLSMDDLPAEIPCSSQSCCEIRGTSVGMLFRTVVPSQIQRSAGLSIARWEAQ